MPSKNRFTTTDTRAMVAEIRLLLGQRVANIYDINEKTYIIKFAGIGSTDKAMLYIESGVRFHLTKYAHAKSDMPSPFTMKLRKHLRTKRLEDIKQLANDRVVDLRFGSGDATMHVILELYAQGNIVMATGDYTIVSLLRSHQFTEDISIANGEVYPIAYATSIKAATTSSAVAGAQGKDTQEEGAGAVDVAVVPSAAQEWVQFLQFCTQSFAAVNERGAGGGEGGKSKQKSGKHAAAATGAGASASMTIMQLCMYRSSPFARYGSEIVEHCLRLCDMAPTEKALPLVEEAASAATCRLRTLFSMFSTVEADAAGTSCVAHQLQLQLDVASPGYVIYKPVQPSADGKKGVVAEVSDRALKIKEALLQGAPQPLSEAAGADAASASSDEGTNARHEDKEFIEFVPRLWKQHEVNTATQSLQFASFGEAVDEYFAKIADQKLKQIAVSTEENIIKKVLKVKTEQEQLIQALVWQQEAMQMGAMSCEVYNEEIDKISLVINSALRAGMSWHDIAAMVDREAKVNCNPYAQLVCGLKLDKGVICVKVPNILYDGDGDEEEEEESSSGGLLADEVAKDKELEGDDADTEADATAGGAAVGANAGSSASMLSKKDKKKQKQGGNNPSAAAGKAGKQGKKAANEQSQAPTAPPSEQPTVVIEIDLSMSANANANRLYAMRKAAAVKEEKTLTAAKRAVESVEAQTIKQLNKVKVKTHLQAVRKVHWFEKFNWFLTTQGFLCLSGRDAQQNELLVKRYLKPHDAYIHADIPGATSCIVKAQQVPVNPAGEDANESDDEDAPSAAPTAVVGKSSGDQVPPQMRTIISPVALQEAAVNTICRSAAWNNKIVIAAWWVWGNQVSKTPPSGEYLPTGSFMIYGKKNFLSPSSLEMGFGVMFRLDDASVARRLQEQEAKRGGTGRHQMQFLQHNADESSSSSGVKSLQAAGGGRRGGRGDDFDETSSVTTAGVNKYGIDYSAVYSLEDSKITAAGAGGNAVAAIAEAVTGGERTRGAAPMPTIGEETTAPDAAAEEIPAEDSNVASSRKSSDESAKTPTPPTQGAAHEGGRRLSAKERKQLKKGQLGDTSVPSAATPPTSSKRGKEAASASTGSPSNNESNVVDKASAKTTKSQPRKAAAGRKGASKGNSNRFGAALGNPDDSADSDASTQQSESGDEDDALDPAESDAEDEEEEVASFHSSRSASDGGGGPDEEVDDEEDEDEEEEEEEAEYEKYVHHAPKFKPATATTAALTGVKKLAAKGGKMNKKKAKKYAEQDDEEREQALQRLGRMKVEDTAAGQEQLKQKHRQKEEDRRKHKEKAGVGLLEKFNEKEYEAVMRALTANVQLLLKDFMDSGLIRSFEVDVAELRALGSFNEVDGLAILTRFKAQMQAGSTAGKGAVATKNKNKSAVLAHVIKEFTQKQAYLKQKAAQESRNEGDESIGASASSSSSSSDAAASSSSSRRALKKAEQEEINAILEEEGVVDEDEAKNTEDIKKLTGYPNTAGGGGGGGGGGLSSLRLGKDSTSGTDGLLYAVPVCAPYCCLQGFKYRVKLTPGTGKKGKTVKQAIEFFTRSKDCTPLEKSLVQGLTDTECVAIMIGDVKISTPGLHAVSGKGGKGGGGKNK